MTTALLTFIRNGLALLVASRSNIYIESSSYFTGSHSWQYCPYRETKRHDYHGTHSMIDAQQDIRGPKEK